MQVEILLLLSSSSSSRGRRTAIKESETKQKENRRRLTAEGDGTMWKVEQKSRGHEEWWEDTPRTV